MGCRWGVGGVVGGVVGEVVGIGEDGGMCTLVWV